MPLELGNFPQDGPKELGKSKRRLNPYRLSIWHMILIAERRALIVNRNLGSRSSVRTSAPVYGAVASCMR